MVKEVLKVLRSSQNRCRSRRDPSTPLQPKLYPNVLIVSERAFYVPSEAPLLGALRKRPSSV